ncbi:hypothetical protein pb186bvf_016270 [Paramecium bursaria]
MRFLILIPIMVYSQSYYMKVDEVLEDILKISPTGYKPWHPQLQVTIRMQKYETEKEFFSFVQQKIQLRQHTYIQTSENLMESLLCKCTFSPPEPEGEGEAEGGEGGDEEAKEESAEPGCKEETEFIMKKTKSQDKDFSFLQVGQQVQYSNEELKQINQKLINQQQLIEQFLQQQSQLVSALTQLQQGHFVPNIMPQVYDPNMLNPQQYQQMMLYMQWQQQQLAQQQAQQMINPLGFQQNLQYQKNEPNPQFQVPFSNMQQGFLQPAQPVVQQLLQQQQVQQQQPLQAPLLQPFMQVQQPQIQQPQQQQIQQPVYQQQGFLQFPQMMNQNQQQIPQVQQQYQQAQQQVPQQQNINQFLQTNQNQQPVQNQQIEYQIPNQQPPIYAQPMMQPMSQPQYAQQQPLIIGQR